MFTSDLEELLRLVHELDADMDIWNDRDEGPSARIRRAGSEAMAGIDKALHELQELRARLHFDLRTYDEETAARADALLAETRPKLAAVDGAGGTPNPLITHPPSGSWTEGLPKREGDKYS